MRLFECCQCAGDGTDTAPAHDLFKEDPNQEVEATIPEIQLKEKSRQGIGGESNVPITFNVTLERVPGALVGLELDPVDGVLLQVCDVKPGPVRAYNESVSVDYQVTVGDFITEVNGVKHDSQQLLKRFKEDEKLQLTVHRPREFTINVEKGGDLLGLELKRAPNGISLLVERVNNGLCKAWNEQHPDQAVQAMDRITQVNGVRLNSLAMMNHAQDAEELTMTIARPVF